MLPCFSDGLAFTMTSSPPDNGIMTIGEVADYLKVTERTIYRLEGAKQNPAFKVGASWRFSKVDIDSWIKEQSAMSGEERTEYELHH
jgi:excisionase family DNA binding protein